MAKTPEPDEPEEKKRSTRKRPAKASADLVRFANDARFRGTVEFPESIEERRSRLRIGEAEAQHRRILEERKSSLEEWRERLILRLGLGIFSVVGIYCLVLIGLPGGSTEPKTWATATLTGIVSGFVGYFVGTAKK